MGYDGRVLKVIRQILALLWKVIQILVARWLGAILRRLALFAFVFVTLLFVLVFLLTRC